MNAHVVRRWLPATRPPVVLLIASAVLGALLVVVASPRAEAWKPGSHLFGVESALADAVDDGRVTIATPDGAPVTVPVNPTVLEALRAHPEAYRAGVIGPDAYPDPIFGQGSEHADSCTENDKHPTPNPSDRCVKDDTVQIFEWYSHLWEQAWNPATPNDERLANIAFALGYMGGHGVGDMWAHTWVNKYAGDVAPPYTDYHHADVLIRHIVVEGYVDLHRPGAQNETTYEARAPLDFVADQLILSDFARAHGSHYLYDFFFSMRDALETEEASADDDMSSQDTFDACIPGVGCAPIPDPTDAPINLVELAWLAIEDAYLEAWIGDINSGLRAWPEISEAISQEMFVGKSPELAPVKAELKEWFLTHFLSMMGLPDFVGTGIHLIDAIIEWVLGFISDVVGGLFDLLGVVPVLGDIIGAIQDVYAEGKAAVTNAIDQIEDDICNYFVGAAFDVEHLSDELKEVLDSDRDGAIECEELTKMMALPTFFLEHDFLFADGTRELIDADMHLKNGVDADSSAKEGRTITLDGFDDDPRGHYRDYDLELFAPLKNTNTMAKLAMLDEHGLNQFFKAKAGGNVSALGDLYPAYTSQDDPLLASKGKSTKVSWPVPHNIMLGVGGAGWMKSIDAEYQFRRRSPNDGRSYGNGTMAFWSDCVARESVIRRMFRQPVTGIDAFVDDPDDPPAGLSDATAPVSTSSLTGPNVTSGGRTYVSGATEIGIATTDNYWPKVDNVVFRRNYAAGDPVPSYGPGVAADPAPFSLTGSDGDKVVNFFAKDGHGRCNSEAEHALALTLDNTPPTVSISSPAAGDYASDLFMLLNFSASDTSSGVDAATAKHFVDGVQLTPVPTTIDLFDYPAGDHVYTAQQADRLGNLGEAAVTWTTVVTHQSLQANLDKAYLVRKCITSKGTYNSLRAELRAAQASDARGNDGASDNQLEAFIREVEGQTGNTVTPYCANVLITNAKALVAS